MKVASNFTNVQYPLVKLIDPFTEKLPSDNFNDVENLKQYPEIKSLKIEVTENDPCGFEADNSFESKEYNDSKDLVFEEPVIKREIVEYEVGKHSY